MYKYPTADLYISCRDYVNSHINVYTKRVPRLDIIKTNYLKYRNYVGLIYIEMSFHFIF